MLRLRKHVQRCYQFQFKDTSGTQNVQVSGQGGGVAGHINYLTGTGATEEFEHLGQTAGAGRVEEDGERLGRDASPYLVEDSGQLLFGGAGDEFAIGPVFGDGVDASGPDGVLVQFDPDEALDKVGQFDGEEADAAISVDEEPGAAAGKHRADDFDQIGKQEKVVLEEGALRDLPAFGRDPQHNFQAPFGRRMRADMTDLLVDGGLGNLAVLNVHHQAAVVAQKADVQPLLELVPLRANHDAIAITIGLRAGNDGRDDFRGEFADTRENVGYLLVLHFVLRGVVDVLVLASAARAKVGAGRDDAVG